MTAACSSDCQKVMLVDFTGSVSGCKQLSSYGPEFVDLVRKDDSAAIVVLIDRAVGGHIDGPVLVRDHLNLSGSNPLLGPNHAIGERFPVVQGIYIEDKLPMIPHVVAAGLKPGVKPSADDWQLIERYGAEACCYNVVPAMLVAAHARRRVLAILLPEGADMPATLLAEIRAVAGAPS